VLSRRRERERTSREKVEPLSLKPFFYLTCFCVYIYIWKMLSILLVLDVYYFLKKLGEINKGHFFYFYFFWTCSHKEREMVNSN
jgi:hypothetical protein